MLRSRGECGVAPHRARRRPRRDDTALRDALDAALVKAKPQIDAILKQEGVPVAPASAKAA